MSPKKFHVAEKVDFPDEPTANIRPISMEKAVQRLCLPRTGVRDALGRPVVQDGLALFARLPHKRLRSVVSRPQRTVEGVTSIGPHANALYFSVAVVSQYGSFRAWAKFGSLWR